MSITVASTNDAPVATADAYATNEDTPLTVSAPGVLANDTDVDGDPLTAVLVTGPTHGTLDAATRTARSPTRRPRTSSAPDTFTYTVSDGDGGLEPRDGDDHGRLDQRLPVATADTYTTNEDTPLTVGAPGVLANDTDVDGDPLSAVLVSRPDARHADAATPMARSPTRRPLNFFGTDAFTYTVSDGGGGFESRDGVDRGRLDERFADRHRRRLRDDRGHPAHRQRAGRPGQRHRRGRRSAERRPGDRPGARHPRR